MSGRPAPSVTAAEFETLTRRAGLSLTEAQRGTLFEVYGNFEAMLARLSGMGERGRGAEPALIFVAGQGWPGQGW